MDNNLSPLDRDIMNELIKNRAMKANELSEKLGVDTTIITRELCGVLSEYCLQDEEGNWNIKKEKLQTGMSSFDEQEYFDVLRRGDLHQLDDYLSSCRDDVLKTPQMLFVKPAISGLVLAKDKIDGIIEYLLRNQIDLNSKEYFQNRNDALKGIDLAGGCVCFPIYYFVQGKKRILKSDEVLMYSNFIIKARENGWTVNNEPPNNKKVQDLVYYLLSRGNKELQPVYDSLFSKIESNERKQDEEPKESNIQKADENQVCIDESRNNCDNENFIANDSVYKVDSQLVEKVKILLNTISINGYVDPTFLSEESVLGKNIRKIIRYLGCKTLDELVETFGLKCGPIVGDVQYTLNDDDEDTSNSSNELLDQKVSGFSNRTMKRFMVYGVSTYRDLLNLDLEEFKQIRGVGEGVITEIQERIAQLLAGSETTNKLEPTQVESVQEELTQEDSYASNVLLDQKVSGFSNITMNRLMMYGVRTNNDLLNLDLDNFYQNPGIENSVINEIKERIAELKKTTETGLASEDIIKEIIEKKPNNSETSSHPELTDIIRELLELYKDKQKERSVEKVFLSNPKYKEYYDLLLEKSKELFGCELNEYLSKIGLIDDSNCIYSDDDFLNSDTQNALLDDSTQTENIGAYDGFADEKDDESIKENVDEELTNSIDETSLFDEEMVRKDLLESSYGKDEENVLWLLNSLFKNKTINLKCIEGTSLRRRLLEYANQNKITLEDYLRSNGYSIDNEANEIYKMTYNRSYRELD